VCDYQPVANLVTQTIDGVKRRRFNLLLPDGVSRIDYPDIVPAWWKDRLAVACKFAELNRE
jgi:hypothetical protein